MPTRANATLISLLAALAVAPPALAVPDIILESRCASGAQYVESGTWFDAAAKTTAPGTVCVAGSRSTQTSNSYAEYIPTIVTAGTYDVYVSWGEFDDSMMSNQGANAEAVTFTFFDQFGSHPVVLNERGKPSCVSSNGNIWVLVGTGDFLAGNTGKLRITHTATSQCHNGSSKRYVNSDAAKFVFVPPAPVRPTTFGTVKALYR